MRVLFVALALLLVKPSGADAVDQLTFQLGWLPGGERAPVFLGVQRGLFAAEDLEIKILAGRGSTDVITKLATGVADIGEVGFDTLVSAKVEGLMPVTAVMPYFTKPADAILTTTTSGIVTLKDIVGRSVATSPFANSTQAWPVFMKRNGLDPARVELIKADPSTLGGLLATGQVEALLFWSTSSPAIAPMLAKVGKKMKLIPWSDYGYEGYSQTLMASNKVLSERPDVVHRFLKVMRQATQMTYDDPDAAAKAVKAMVPQGDFGIISGQIEASLPLMVNEVTRRDGLGVFSPGLVRKTWEWVAKASNYPVDKIDPMQGVDTKIGSF
jgi:NitT/TauT family transport system substrate-binding protein